MGYFTKVTCIEEVKKQYKELLQKWHPDCTRTDTNAEMAKINVEYEKLFATYRNTHKKADGSTYEKESQETETAEKYRDLLESLMRFDGVIIEIIGSFVWLSGNTKEYKEQIKTLGFRWSKTKSMWYKSPSGYRRKGGKDYSIDTIRNMYESEEFKSKGTIKVTA